MKEHALIRVYGEVQGVLFRDSAKRKAEEFGLTGFARNEPDGSVLIEAEGERAALENFAAWCHEGPPSASIKEVKMSIDSSIKNFLRFVIE